MCGIVAIFDTRGRREIDRRLLQAMNDAVAHRGPDGEGFHIGPGIGLGQRRLAIIDLSGGRQPMYNEDGTVGAVFNGEIYNFQTVRAELEQHGHAFKTNSDTEVIVHGWEQWGAAVVDRLNGMFAIALWDANRETLFLARDRLGKKPLYWTVLEDGLMLIASELKSILLHGGASRRIDPTAVEEYFAYGYVPDPKTIYAGIHKLPPAHRMAWRRGAPQPRSEAYWDVSFARTTTTTDERALTEELIDRLREATRLRLISDVPLGAFLSGGVDSSGIVAMMAGLSPEPVRTFSIGFREKAYDESAYARQVAERYRTKHTERVVDPEAFDLIDRIVHMFDEPFADSSALPTYRVSALAREQVTVALSGDAGDELFAGYRRYRWHAAEERVRAMLPQAVRGPLFGALGALYPKLDWLPRPLRAKTTLQELALDSIAGFFLSVSVVHDGLRRRLFSERMKRDLAGYHAIEVLAHHMNAADTEDPLARVQYADLKTWLPGDILVKVDRASMAASLESRAPLLDYNFVEWAATLPAAMKLKNGNGKHLLKKALEPYVPQDLLYRPKQGFSIPLPVWFRGPLRSRLEAAVLGQPMADSGLFDMTQLKSLLAEHQSGLRDHAPTLWSLMMFGDFLSKVHAGESAADTRLAAAV
jgi:asparagine synthase (glutamine-hydrolysing)